MSISRKRRGPPPAREATLRVPGLVDKTDPPDRHERFPKDEKKKSTALLLRAGERMIEQRLKRELPADSPRLRPTMPKVGGGS
jgi:hypothetical protein